MIIIFFVTLVLLLLVLGAFRQRFQEATLHWGRIMAGQGQIEQDIQEAKEAGDAPHAAELLGRSIHHRGLQDELTPPLQTNLAIGYWIACVAVFVWGFFLLPWYVALLWPIFFGIGNRWLKNRLPATNSDYYRQKIISSLASRRDRYQQDGDNLRAHMAGIYIQQLKQYE